MSYRNLVIIDNEKVSKKNNNFYCDNFEAKISEDLGKNFNLTFIARKSKIDRARQINLKNIKTSPNLFLFLLNIFKTFKNRDTNYLLISVSPYTFFSFLLLFFFRKKIFVYLRSNGHEEYKAIFGFFGPLIYGFMFKIVTFSSNIISCQERLFTKRKSNIVFPSDLNSIWFKNKKKPVLDKPRLLYVGRIKVEKGIFSLIKFFDELDIDCHLSIVGRLESPHSNTKKISFIGHKYNIDDLIKIYDNNNIFILPSFTEAHPKVIDESLARSRPIIIFEEIKHIIQNRKGIFVAERNAKSLLETINFVMQNYTNIQGNIDQNKLPTKKDFILQMSNILNQN